MNIQIQQLHCQRCGHDWAPRKQDVRQCPKCKSAYWDQEPDSTRDSAKAED